MAAAIGAAMLLPLGVAGCGTESDPVPVEQPVEQDADEDADNMADPENEDESDLEDAGDQESSEEEGTVSEDDLEPTNE